MVWPEEATGQLPQLCGVGLGQRWYHTACYFLDETSDVLCLKGDMKRGQLEQDTAKCPYITGERIESLRADLRTKIIGRAHCLLYYSLLISKSLGNTEVADSQVVLLCEKKVLGLHVSVDNLSLVQVFQTKDDLREPSNNLGLFKGFAKATIVADPLCEVTTFCVVHDNRQGPVIDEALVVADDVRMLQ